MEYFKTANIKPKLKYIIKNNMSFMDFPLVYLTMFQVSFNTNNFLKLCFKQLVLYEYLSIKFGNIYPLFYLVPLKNSDLCNDYAISLGKECDLNCRKNLFLTDII